MSTVLRLIGALALAMFGAVGSAMLTTDYSTMRRNGASYLPALQTGLGSIAHSLWAFVTSAWFLIPVGAIVLIFVTVRLTLRASRPKIDPYASLGNRMNGFVNAAHHDQKYRQFTTMYHDTMRICREMEAFMEEVRLNGLPVPSPQSNSAEDWIDLAGDYFTAVGPYLRNGNFAAAVNVAQGYANRYP
jgi:hypothetical protein